MTPCVVANYSLDAPCTLYSAKSFLWNVNEVMVVMVFIRVVFMRSWNVTTYKGKRTRGRELRTRMPIGPAHVPWAQYRPG